MQNDKIKPRLTKISSGYYQGRYNYVDFKIVKTITMQNEVLWHWEIKNTKVNDTYSKKSTAIESLIDFVDNQHLYN